MASEWLATPLGDICDLFDGPHQTAPLTPEGPIVYLNVGDIRGGRIELRLSGRLSEETARIWSSRVTPQPGDVVFGYEATIGHAALLSSDHRWCLGRRVGLLRPRRNQVEPRFLLYAWYSPRFQETLRANRVGGTTIESIRLTDLPSWTIDLPDLEEQRRIADILGALDDAVESNRRMNETLEAMARALFKSWFVDFDPVRAKAGGRDPGLPQRIADLFPDRFEDSELGPVPAGWSIGRVRDTAAQIREMEDPRLKPDGVFSHYSLPAFDVRREPVSELGRGIRSQKWRVQPGTVLVSKLNPKIERVWLADVAKHERAISSTEFLVLLPRIPFTRAYVYCLSRSEAFRQAVEGLVTGTSGSHQRAHAGSILDLAVVLPPTKVIEAFDRQSEALLARTLAGRRESPLLASLRDALLPKLISGELRVSDAERMLEAAPV